MLPSSSIRSIIAAWERLSSTSRSWVAGAGEDWGASIRRIARLRGRHPTLVREALSTLLRRLAPLALNAGRQSSGRRTGFSSTSRSGLLSFLELRCRAHAARERRALLAFGVLVAHPLAGFAGGELLVVGGLRHRGHALAERRAFLTGDVLLALALTVDAVGLRLFGL